MSMNFIYVLSMDEFDHWSEYYKSTKTLKVLFSAITTTLDTPGNPIAILEQICNYVIKSDVEDMLPNGYTSIESVSIYYENHERPVGIKLTCKSAEDDSLDDFIIKFSYEDSVKIQNKKIIYDQASGKCPVNNRRPH